METITEGGAKIALSEGVFYNPKMKTLRDISVLFLKGIKAKGRLLDSTGATGVRGIRYAKEAGIKDATCLDINEQAYKSIKGNARRNKLHLNAVNSSIHEFSARGEPKDLFDIIDLDPFGSPMPYLDDIMRLSKDRTILMVTATDTAVLCGAHASACVKIYGSKPMHNELHKESGMRILINYIIRSAARFNFGVEMLLCLSDLHYMRVFVRLNYSAGAAVASIKECGLATFCAKCHGFAYAKGLSPLVEKKCAVCGAKTEGFGPMFLGKLYDKALIEKILKAGSARSVRFADAGKQLGRVSNELDTPFFYSLPKMTRSLRISSVSDDKVVEALLAGGFGASRTQFDRDGIKTNAGVKGVLDAVRSTARQGSASNK